MVELKEQGVVKAIGTGMNQWEMPARFMQDFHLDIVLLAGRATTGPMRLRAVSTAVRDRWALASPWEASHNSGILAAADFMARCGSTINQPWKNGL